MIFHPRTFDYSIDLPEIPDSFTAPPPQKKIPTLSLSEFCGGGTSLVVQWLRIRSTAQGTRVPSLVGELRSHIVVGQLLSPRTLEPLGHS